MTQVAYLDPQSAQIDSVIRTLTARKDAALKGEKGKTKRRAFAEVTTSCDLIDDQLALLPVGVIHDLHKRILDPATGDGRYLMRYLLHRLPAITTPEELFLAVATLFGVDIQEENVLLARRNMYILTQAICKVKGFPYFPEDVLFEVFTQTIREGNFLELENGFPQ